MITLLTTCLFLQSLYARYFTSAKACAKAVFGHLKPAEICSSSLLFLAPGFLAFPWMIEKKIEENGEHFCILLCYFFNAK